MRMRNEQHCLAEKYKWWLNLYCMLFRYSTNICLFIEASILWGVINIFKCGEKNYVYILETNNYCCVNLTYQEHSDLAKESGLLITFHYLTSGSKPQWLKLYWTLLRPFFFFCLVMVRKKLNGSTSLWEIPEDWWRCSLTFTRKSSLQTRKSLINSTV